MVDCSPVILLGLLDPPRWEELPWTRTIVPRGPHTEAPTVKAVTLWTSRSSPVKLPFLSVRVTDSWSGHPYTHLDSE